MFKSLIAIAALAAAGTANATVLFSDNFDSYPAALTVTSLGSNWAVTGNVDVVDQVNPFGIGVCLGRCVDLDGTTGPGQLLSKPIAVGAGTPILISFDLSGNQRGGADDVFNFEATFDNGNAVFFQVVSGFTSGITGNIFGTTGVYQETIGAGRPYVNYVLSLTPSTQGSMKIRFSTTSADNIGPLLDNVLVTQGVIPEPATWAMLIAGFGLVGTAMRRRRASAA
jgi:hypothetical protein